MKKGLIAAFEKAGLSLELLDAPLRKGLGMDKIVQMDIQRSNKTKELRNEWFRIYPGQERPTRSNGKQAGTTLAWSSISETKKVFTGFLSELVTQTTLKDTAEETKPSF